MHSYGNKRRLDFSTIARLKGINSLGSGLALGLDGSFLLTSQKPERKIEMVLYSLAMKKHDTQRTSHTFSPYCLSFRRVRGKWMQNTDGRSSNMYP